MTIAATSPIRADAVPCGPHAAGTHATCRVPTAARRIASLIAVYNSEGLVGRCDGKCHNAKSSECDCICGGRNHGRGDDGARDYHEKNLLGDELAAELKAFRESHHLEGELKIVKGRELEQRIARRVRANLSQLPLI
jgi:hypothetical protein